jgi:hypothetical protein
MKEKWEKLVDFYYVIYHKIYNLPYALKMRFIRKHHIIKTSLNPWCGHDTDDILLYGMMDCFKKFYDEEVVDGVVNYNVDDEHKVIRQSMEEIYLWWKDYPNRLKQIEDALDNWFELERATGGFALDKRKTVQMKRTKECQEAWERLPLLEELLYIETQAVLTKLVKIRGSLWT